MTEHLKKSVTIKLPKWAERLLFVLVIVGVILITDRLVSIREYVDIACKESKTIQQYDSLRLSCAVIVLDWRTIDDILSQMRFMPWNGNLYIREVRDV